MAHRKLQENGLSTRGLTKKLMERLARFDIRNQIPNREIEWDDAVDLASNSKEQDERGNSTEPPARSSQGAEAVGVQEQALGPNEKEREEDEDLEFNPYALQPPPRKQKNASTTTPAIAKNRRLYLAEEIRMLNGREENGNFRQFQHFSRAGLIYSPDRPTGTIPITSTVLGPQVKSRITDRDRLQSIPNLKGL